MSHMAVDFAHLLETDPFGKGAPHQGQIFGVVLEVRSFRLFVRERFIQRKIYLQRLVSLIFGNCTENLIQFFRRNLPGVFGYTFRYICGDKYIVIFNIFFSFRSYGSLWQGVASCKDKMALADNISFASFNFRSWKLSPLHTSILAPVVKHHPHDIGSGNAGQQSQNFGCIHRHYRSDWDS